jgi:membrane-associated phospholipid phosphatase
MPTYLFLLLSQAFPPALDPIQPSSHLLFIGLIFIVTFLLPVLNLGIMKALGSIRSFQMETREERLLPFTMIALLYIAITFLFYYKTRVSVSDNFLKLMIVIDLLAVVASIITYFYKVSVHSLCAWGIVAIIILLNKASELNSLFYPAIIAIVLTGFIMSARVYLKAHSLREVLWGGIVGLATGIVGMIVLFTN